MIFMRRELFVHLLSGADVPPEEVFRHEDFRGLSLQEKTDQTDQREGYAATSRVSFAKNQRG